MVTLVLLPGMDGTGRLFDPFIAALGSEFRVQVVRYPTQEPLDYSQLEAVARAALPVDGPFVIVAESFSGPIAVSLAASDPPRLQGLILCATFVRNPRPGFAFLRSIVGLLPVGWMPAGVLSRLLLGRAADPLLRSALAQAVAQVSSSAFRARLRAVLSVDVSARLSAVTVPSLYLRAARDAVVPPAACELIARFSPRTQVVELDGPHLLLQAAPAAAAKTVGTFLREIQKGF